MLPLATPLLGSIGSAAIGGIKKLFGGRQVTLPPGAAPPPIPSKNFPGGSFFDIGEVAPKDMAFVDSRNGNVYVSRSGGVYQIKGSEADAVKKWWIEQGAFDNKREAWLYRSDGALKGQKPAARDVGGELVFDTSGIKMPIMSGSMWLLGGLALGSVLLLVVVLRK